MMMKTALVLKALSLRLKQKVRTSLFAGVEMEMEMQMRNLAIINLMLITVYLKDISMAYV